ncbi:YqaA family protein [Pigmentiphaga soli]|uniref:YqaA family protein n=1 Tax=Pigmentiphaga soli TaxID=1007095 RepID=A0ABP8HBR7_9BURK
MQIWLEHSVHWLLAALALPRVGLPAILVVSLLSATLLPMGSEPAVFGYVKLAPHMFWPAVLTATIGNTLGGIVSYWMGWWAHRGMIRLRERYEARHGHPHPHAHQPHQYDLQTRRGRMQARAHDLLERFGPKTLLLSWVPMVGDPLCAVAGWLRMDFWPSVLYMAIGKLARYLTMTTALLWFF